MAEDLGAHTLELAVELLADVELDRLSIQALLLKASRLARLVGDDEVQDWLAMEMRGFPMSQPSPLARTYMERTGRWVDQATGVGYFEGALELEGIIAAADDRLKALRLPAVSGEWASIALRETRADLANAAKEAARMKGVRAKVLACLHTFIATRYYELAFSARQAELFGHARGLVDQLLAPLSGQTLSKVDSIYRRLAEGDAEATSQALTTCRRLIDAVADALYPPTDQTVELDTNELKLTKQHVQNRLNAHIADRVSSKSRRDRFRRTLADLYGRVSAGVHDEVDGEEARYLILGTYLYLGEVLGLSDPEPALGS